MNGCPAKLVLNLRQCRNVLIRPRTRARHHRRHAGRKSRDALGFRPRRCAEYSQVLRFNVSPRSIRPRQPGRIFRAAPASWQGWHDLVIALPPPAFLPAQCVHGCTPTSDMEGFLILRPAPRRMSMIVIGLLQQLQIPGSCLCFCITLCYCCSASACAARRSVDEDSNVNVVGAEVTTVDYR
ncbi:hypothetical protein GY45DRAFT_1323314 [Cubamyces sp. BRFM 1775]|nr:hypothetical protein GY45DRAFT_1323314 [Cubamyces sp. BRFM 1775]